MNEFFDRYLRVPITLRMAGAVAIYIVVSILYYFLFHGPAQNKVQALNVQLAELNQQKIEKEAYVANLPEYEARLAELQSNLQMARAMLPDEASVPEFLAQLGNKARQAGLNIESFEPKGEVPADFFAEIIFLIKLRGSFHEIASFIDSIGKIDRIVNVSGIVMNTPETENKKMMVKSELTIKTYRFLSEEQRKVLQDKKAAAGAKK